MLPDLERLPRVPGHRQERLDQIRAALARLGPHAE